MIIHMIVCDNGAYLFYKTPGPVSPDDQPLQRDLGVTAGM